MGKQKPENLKTEISPGSLNNTVEEQIRPPLNSLGTVSPENVEVIVKVNHPEEGKRAILRWDYYRGSRLRVRQVTRVSVGGRGEKVSKVKKIISWDTAGKVTELVAKAAGAGIATYEKTKRS